MQAIKDITLQLSAETERQLTDRIAWFYLRHLNDADAKPAAALNQLLTQSERAELPEAQGAKEKVARSGPCTRKALLEAQLYDTINSYTKQFEMRDDGIPQSLRRQMNGRLSSFNEQAARKLAENAMRCIRQGGSAAQTVQEMLTVFDKAVKRFAGDVDTAYTQASWYCLIKEYENEGHHRFRYVVEDKDGLCNACLLQSEQTYTLAELLKQNLLPPLHPNCRCALVPDDELPAVDDRDAGGRTRAEGNWYDALLRIPADAKKLVSGVMAAQQERLHRGTLAGFADWFTLGIVSGAWSGMSERFAALTDDPSLYTALDWATMGSAGMVKGAVAPEEPLSLEHWLNALGTASLALSVYSMTQNITKEVFETPRERTYVVEESAQRPTWRQSEIDGILDYPDHEAQLSFKNGKRVPYSTKSSVRPDFYREGSSVDYKNYDISTLKKRSNLVYNIRKQYFRREIELPLNTQQTFVIDVRGQDIAEDILNQLYDKIVQQTSPEIVIRFKVG